MTEGYRVPEDYLTLAEEFMPFTTEKAIGTFQHIWEIKNWSTLAKDIKVTGPAFKTGDCTWNVLLYPNGNNQADQVSLYIENIELKKNEEASDICAQIMLFLVHPHDSTKFIHQVFQHRFNKQETDRGYTKFIDIKVLLFGNEQYGPFVVNDSCKIITIVRLIEDSTGVLWHNFIDYDSKEMTGYVGLYNQGATCYMNSLFQSLFFTNFYRKALYQIPTENDDPNNSIVLALQRLFYNLQFSDTAASTIELTTSFGWNSIDSFMQHDVQEFNRLLQDNIEKKMRGTPANDSIKQLFVGRMKSYIKCLNVDYESSRSEDFYDIQLNVKECKNLQESFNTYVSEEILEGENKYMASGHGLQDAKKGVIFESFPPVLHLQLKRFEYDMVKDSMIKINDRHEFPAEIDLEPFLSDSVDKSESYRYSLHGVLVHTGDLTGGHYFAFVRPTKQDKWFKFDDDRVTPASKNQVFEENFGGETLLAHPKHRSIKRFTNAYMLVYIRESHQDQVLKEVTENDIPTHLMERIRKENHALQLIKKRHEEQHLYTKVYIASDVSFLSNYGPKFIQFDENAPPTSPPVVLVKFVLKTQTLRELLEEYAMECGSSIEYFRLWNLGNRRSGSVQLDCLFSDQDLDLSIEQVCEQEPDYPFLRVYVENACVSPGDLPCFPAPDSNLDLVFIKLFDPIVQTLRGIGRLYVVRNSQISSILDSLNAMGGFQEGTLLDVYEEIDHKTVHKLDLNATFQGYKITNGDILCFQVKLSLESIFNLHANGLYSNVSDYMGYLYNRITVVFGSKSEPFDEFSIVLRKDMYYEDLISQIGEYINCDPEFLLLILPDCYGSPKKAVRPVIGMQLIDILMLIPKQKEVNDNQMLFKLYYDILSVSVSEYESKKLIRLNICYPALNQLQFQEFLMPKLAKISDICQRLSNVQRFRIFKVVHDKVEKVFKYSDIIPDDEAILFAEIVPKEELQVGDQDFYINVYHFQKEVNQTHSVPFKFLVIKDEELHATKMRLQQRCGLNDQEWDKVKINIVTRFTIKTLKDDFRLSDYHFKSEEVLGLDHTDPFGRYNLPVMDRGLYIKD